MATISFFEAYITEARFLFLAEDVNILSVRVLSLILRAISLHLAVGVHCLICHFLRFLSGPLGYRSGTESQLP